VRQRAQLDAAPCLTHRPQGGSGRQPATPVAKTKSRGQNPPARLGKNVASRWASSVKAKPYGCYAALTAPTFPLGDNCRLAGKRRVLGKGGEGLEHSPWSWRSALPCMNEARFSTAVDLFSRLCGSLAIREACAGGIGNAQTPPAPCLPQRVLKPTVFDWHKFLSIQDGLLLCRRHHCPLGGLVTQ